MSLSSEDKIETSSKHKDMKPNENSESEMLQNIVSSNIDTTMLELPTDKEITDPI